MPHGVMDGHLSNMPSLVCIAFSSPGASVCKPDWQMTLAEPTWRSYLELPILMPKVYNRGRV